MKARPDLAEEIDLKNPRFCEKSSHTVRPRPDAGLWLTANHSPSGQFCSKIKKIADKNFDSMGDSLRAFPRIDHGEFPAAVLGS